jgi:hypothetical protein
MRFEVLTSLTPGIAVLCDSTSGIFERVANISQKHAVLGLAGRHIFETFVTTYQFKRRHIPRSIYLKI